MFRKALLYVKENLFSAIGFMIVATSFANFLNYVFNVVVARLLGPDRYGEFAALIALLTIFTIPSGSLQALVTKYISQFMVTDDMGGVRDLVIKFFKICAYASFVIMVTFLAFRGILADYLHIEGDVAVIVTGITVSATLLTPVFAGILQGMQRFVWLGTFFVAYTVARIIFGWIFILLGGGVAGGIGGGTVAVVISGLLTYLVAREAFAPAPQPPKAAIRIAGILKSYLPIITSMVLFYALVSFDQIIVKRKFPAGVAGEYACASFIGKIILYFPSAVAIVLYPRMVELFAEGKRKRITELLAQGSLITLGAGLALALLFMAFPGRTISILYGSEYLGARSILWIFCLAMSFYALVNLLVYFFLAVNGIGFIMRVLVAAFVVELLAMYVVASTPFQVASVHIAVTAIIAAASFAKVAGFARRK